MTPDPGGAGRRKLEADPAKSALSEWRKGLTQELNREAFRKFAQVNGNVITTETGARDTYTPSCSSGWSSVGCVGVADVVRECTQPIWSAARAHVVNFSSFRGVVWSTRPRLVHPPSI
jgi:hypothetical protein